MKLTDEQIQEMANNHFHSGQPEKELAIARIGYIAGFKACQDRETWISVRDNLPPIMQGVLVAFKSGLITIAYRTFEDGYKIWRLFGDIAAIFDLENEEVTHWRELPTPPSPTKDR